MHAARWAFLTGCEIICDHCETEFEPRVSGGTPQRFCPGGECRKAFHTKARRTGAVALRKLGSKGKRGDFEVERLSPEFQAEVAKILAWAEPQRPATPAAWGMAPAVETEPRAEQSKLKETVREAPAGYGKRSYEETPDLHDH